MTARLPLGADVIVARNGYGTNGRLLVFGGGASGFFQDYRPGYAGWDYNAATIAACEALAPRCITWLTGLETGAALLLLNTADQRGRAFGTHFEEYVESLGHTFTLSGAMNEFGAYDPHDFDAVLIPTYAVGGGNDYTEEVDDYLATGGSVFGTVMVAEPALWSRYGFGSTGNQTYVGGPNYLRALEAPTPLGPDTYSTIVSASSRIDAATNTEGGTSEIYHNTLGEGVMGMWVQ